MLQKAKSLHRNPEDLPISVIEYLQARSKVKIQDQLPTGAFSNHEQLLIGNLATAVDAAKSCALQLGYQVETGIQSDPSETVKIAAQRMVDWLTTPGNSPRMLIDAGEPLVKLCEHPGLGGRNQQLVLTVLHKLIQKKIILPRFCLLSGGTDGEDGNTSAAGAMIDERILESNLTERSNVSHYLGRNDAHSFFVDHGGLLVTGLTGTNVGDLRIVTAV
jgi:glycerate-2-kinase